MLYVICHIDSDPWAPNVYYLARGANESAALASAIEKYPWLKEYHEGGYTRFYRIESAGPDNVIELNDLFRELEESRKINF